MKKVTINDVARAAGVSATSVSHAINHASRVSPEIRQRVEKAIKALGYSPLPQARSLRTGKTNVVALLIPDILNPFYNEIVRASQSYLHRTNRDVMILHTDTPGRDAMLHSMENLHIINTKGVEGAIISEFAFHGVYEAIRDVQVPCVLIGHQDELVVDGIRRDEWGGSYAMGLHVARAGHRRVLHITGPSEFRAANLRVEGFRAGLLEGGVAEQDQFLFTGTSQYDSGAKGVRWLLEDGPKPRPTAIYFSNFLMCLGGLAELYDRGLRVPDDIAVCVFGNHEPMEYIRPRLTRTGVNITALTDRACSMLVERLDGRYDGPPRDEVVPCEFAEGDSI